MTVACLLRYIVTSTTLDYIQAISLQIQDQTALDVADRSVLPVFELHKRKRDINKNLEKSAAAAAVTSVGPVIQIQSFKRPLEKEKVQKEEINKTPGVVSNKNSETSNLGKPKITFVVVFSLNCWHVLYISPIFISCIDW